MNQEERLNRKQEEERLHLEVVEAREALQRAELEHESACKASEVFDLKPTSAEQRNPVDSRLCRASRNC